MQSISELDDEDKGHEQVQEAQGNESDFLTLCYEIGRNETVFTFNYYTDI